MQKNMQNLAKYAPHICGVYAAYAAYMRHIFSAYFRHMQIRVTKNQNYGH